MFNFRRIQNCIYRELRKNLNIIPHKLTVRKFYKKIPRQRALLYQKAWIWKCKFTTQKTPETKQQQQRAIHLLSERILSVARCEHIRRNLTSISTSASHALLRRNIWKFSSVESLKFYPLAHATWQRCAIVMPKLLSLTHSLERKVTTNKSVVRNRKS